MKPAPILLLGDPRLRRISSHCINLPGGDATVQHTADRLVATLHAFRSTHGFGLAIAAPQIGELIRMVVVNTGSGPLVMVNPHVTWRSRDHVSLWDSCMCFPFLVVRVGRSASISVEWEDLNGREYLLEECEPALSSLLQHEIDHLDGILAVDHMFDRDALVARDLYEADRDQFRQMVNLPEVQPQFVINRP